MPKKILTIDDDPYIVKYITEVLSDNGYATCSASSVEEALSVLEAERPDLVTLDMEMPDEWGPRFYRKMSMNPAFKDTPVIVISGLQGIHLAIRSPLFPPPSSQLTLLSFTPTTLINIPFLPLPSHSFPPLNLTFLTSPSFPLLILINSHFHPPQVPYPPPSFSS